LFLDIDRFKSINDRYGHEVGNLVLQQLAHILKAELRSADTLARFGGDEFIALLIGVDEASGITIGERLQRRIALKRFGHPEQDIKVSLSLGLASYPKHGSEENSLIKCADLNMYRTKKLHLSPEYHSL
jgi:two-component system, cell cycle response regulator